MTKKIILCIGGFKLPDGTASAQRALENGYLLESLGFKMVFVGKFDKDKKNHIYQNIEGFDCFNITSPTNTKAFPYYAKNADSIKHVVSTYGINEVHSIIAYNYPPIALNKLISFGKKNNINIILDSTEWYGFEGKGIIRNVMRFVATQYRMRVLAKKAGNVICASRFLQTYYTKLNTVILPFSINPNKDKWMLPKIIPTGSPRTFIYAGNPGIGMSKDFVNSMIEGLSKVKEKGYKFKLIIVGIKKDEFLLYFPDYFKILNFLDSDIDFLGRQPHLKTLELIKKSDYSLLIRPNNRVSNAGFPTKIVEAVSCGTPPITNITSDIADYIKEGENGLIFNSTSLEDIEVKLISAIEMPEENLTKMKNNCHTKNPFHMDNFKLSMQNFINVMDNNRYKL
jgi:glycosyltransferase involved in cell wall biosynthesis